MNALTAPRDTDTKATREQISQALLLLTSLPYRRDGDGQIKAEAYHIAMSGCTRYGLNLATQAALKGEHGSTFFPGPADLRRLYETAMAPVYRQRQSEQRREEREAEPETRRYTPEQVRSTQAEVARRLADNPSMAERALEGTPLGRRMARLRMEHEGRLVLATGVSLEAFRRGAAKHEWGVGASYVPLLETVYGVK